MNQDSRPEVSPEVPPAPHLSDDEIIRRAGRAKNGGKFRRLWGGDRKGYCSPSEADLALCRILAFYAQGDADRVADLFARSELGKRDKWRQSQTYRDRTIRAAVTGLTEFYGPGPEILVRGDRLKQVSSGFTRKQDTTDEPKTAVGVGEQGEGQADCRPTACFLDLAEADRELPLWRASFNLARRLRSVTPTNPEQFEAGVRAYCEHAGRPFDEFWYDYLAVWEVVETPEGDSALVWAKRRAEEQPYCPPCSYGKHYGLVVGMAYHLSVLQEGKPFWLSRKGISQLLGVSEQTISNITKLMVKDKLIVCTMKDWSYVDRKCKEYVFTGPPLLTTTTSQSAGPPPF
jgi:hypothetical protein